MVTVHCSPNWKVVFGVKAQVLKSLVWATVASLCRPVAVQVMLYHPPTASTGSLKSTVMLESYGAIVALVVGPVPPPDGPNSPPGVVLRGLGPPASNSLRFWWESVPPPFFLKRA